MSVVAAAAMSSTAETKTKFSNPMHNLVDSDSDEDLDEAAVGLTPTSPAYVVRAAAHALRPSEPSMR